MDLKQIPLFAKLTRQMTWLSERQKVLAQNIANADTPGYTPHDLTRPDFGEMARAAGGGLKLAATRPGHIATPAAADGAFRSAKARGFETSPAGNSVVLEEQMMKVSETQVDYELMTRLYSKHVGLLKLALGKR